MSRLLSGLTAVAAVAGLTAASFGQLHAGDVFLDVQNGRIVTGSVDNGDGAQIGQRVFSANFGDSGFDGFTSDPGFDSLPGTFPAGTAIGFNALAGWTVWNGDGFEPSGGEALFISFGQPNVTVEDQPVSGFAINVQPDGGWHRHLDYFILGPNGTSALPGIYLLELELYSTSASIDPSEPFFKVFNYNMPSAVHDDAIQWVIDNLLGEDCPADLNGDGAVDALDLLALLGAWGSCPGECPADLNDDGTVDALDLLILLGEWGPCP